MYFIFACKLEDHDRYTSANHCKGHLVGGKSPVTSDLSELVKTFQMGTANGRTRSGDLHWQFLGGSIFCLPFLRRFSSLNRWWFSGERSPKSPRKKSTDSKEMLCYDWVLCYWPDLKRSLGDWSSPQVIGKRHARTGQKRQCPDQIWIEGCSHQFLVTYHSTLPENIAI